MNQYIAVMTVVSP